MVQLEALIKAASAQIKMKEGEMEAIYRNEHLIKSITSLALAKLPQVSQIDLGMSAKEQFFYPKVSPKLMPAPAVRGIGQCGRPFIAVRCAPLNKHTLEHAKVEFVWQRYTDKDLKWNYHNSADIVSYSGNMSREDFERLAKLLRNEPVKSENPADCGVHYKII